MAAHEGDEGAGTAGTVRTCYRFVREEGAVSECADFTVFSFLKQILCREKVIAHH